MARFLKNRTKLHGQIPGSLIFIGRKKVDHSSMEYFTYDKEIFTEETISDFSTWHMNDAGNVKWLNIAGLQDTELIGKVGALFNLSPLAMEDILNTGQRPKVMDDEPNLFIFMKEIEFSRNEKRIKTDHITILLGQGYVITFQEEPGDPFNPVRDRIRNNRGRIRASGADYLVYSLIDTLVDGYIQQIELLGNDMEELEEKIIHHPGKETLSQIYLYKKEVSYLRKIIRPMKEIMLNLLKNESALFNKKTITFLKDLDDLVNEAVESVEIYYNMANDLLTIYHANMSQRVNDVMRTLTIFTVLFIPLTFIVGVYGTNFDNLPELHMHYGYYYMWAGMALIVMGMFFYFRKKRWL